MTTMMMMMTITPADPGCQDEDDRGHRYAGTATVTVSGRSLHGIDKRIYKRMDKRMDKRIEKKYVKEYLKERTKEWIKE